MILTFDGSGRFGTLFQSESHFTDIHAKGKSFPESEPAAPVFTPPPSRYACATLFHALTGAVLNVRQNALAQLESAPEQPHSTPEQPYSAPGKRLLHYCAD